ncbi:DUF4625 domain-containing protein [Flammeovirga kamogawensis]|uniref:DUF4625 domain-containing protein n=1 Tax=Flammeovirga kamogawensis TaxID=373891 RepID=A0ABX8GY23_9BACT|nr:DUF4625 domain-containing protein [Flammeovirga kamogawensis]MBB6458930.1 ABC-type nickel/cobalt efflux system permease component RcnA [Flammeovirga kamogawensis]QWG08506.1 DUF4625 domain-containing protein [Flammeovirga kamogawensis]TRX66799.1 DUF4625 domain-containing protein [Flammeovirga kamogawensis]
MKKYIAFISFLLIGFVSCNNETEKGPAPEIKNYTITPVEHDHARTSDDDHDHDHDDDIAAIVIVGEEARIEADLSAQQGLTYVKLNVHFGDDDHHDHARLTATDSVKWTFNQTWEFGKEGGLTGEGDYPTTFAFDEEIDIPTTIDGKPLYEGNYHFQLFIGAKADNSSDNEANQVLTVEVTSEEHDHDH